MALRLLHTSDWHLGGAMERASCEEEQQRFLDWLVATIAERDVDVLVVAGDVFHYAQPSSAALAQYYGFLVRCATETDLRQVVVVGGNHDSASRLDAPAPVLQALDVHVVGGIWADEDSWRRCLCPITGASGEVEAVVAAVPYVQESRLGIRTADCTDAELRQRYQEAFTHLYARLADWAHDDHPDAALVATGHLTCTAAGAEFDADDFHTEIHQVGSIQGLPPAIFDERYCYAALGHIHRCYAVGDRRVWYSGTPVPTGKTELGQRFVLTVDVDADGASATKVEVPRFRGVWRLAGELAALEADLAHLPDEGDDDLAPYLYVELQVDTPEDVYPAWKRLGEFIDEQFADRPRPLIIEAREKIAQIADEAGGTGPIAQETTLGDLSEEQVFCELHRQKFDRPPSDEVLRAFRALLAGDGSDFAVTLPHGADDEETIQPAEPVQIALDAPVSTEEAT